MGEGGGGDSIVIDSVNNRGRCHSYTVASTTVLIPAGWMHPRLLISWHSILSLTGLLEYRGFNAVTHTSSTPLWLEELKWLGGVEGRCTCGGFGFCGFGTFGLFFLYQVLSERF